MPLPPLLTIHSCLRQKPLCQIARRLLAVAIGCKRFQTVASGCPADAFGCDVPSAERTPAEPTRPPNRQRTLSPGDPPSAEASPQLQAVSRQRRAASEAGKKNTPKTPSLMGISAFVLLRFRPATIAGIRCDPLLNGGNASGIGVVDWPNSISGSGLVCNMVDCVSLELDRTTGLRPVLTARECLRDQPFQSPYAIGTGQRPVVRSSFQTEPLPNFHLNHCLQSETMPSVERGRVSSSCAGRDPGFFKTGTSGIGIGPDQAATGDESRYADFSPDAFGLSRRSRITISRRRRHSTRALLREVGIQDSDFSRLCEEDTNNTGFGNRHRNQAAEGDAKP